MYFSTNSPAPPPRSRSVWPAQRLSPDPPFVRPRRLLGDDAAVLAQVFQGQSGAPAAPNVQQTVQQAMSQGGLYTAENCSGIVGNSKMSTTMSTVGSIAMKIAPATGAAAPFVLAAAGIMNLFGAIFGHHAAKVKQEQQIICAVVQSVNDALTAIDQLVQTGQTPATQASQALDALYSQLQQQVQPILKQDASHCNAACFILAEARGVIAKRKDAYSKILPPQASQACAQMYWQLYPDVAASAAFGPAGGAAGAWSHFQQYGMKEGRTWPCDANGNPTSAAASGNPVAAISATVDNLAASAGIPSWAIWGIGALLLVKVIR
jgi:hypothetical protein